MSIQDFARKREVQILAVFGVVTLTAYYFWLKKTKEGLGWANASGKLGSKIASPDCPTKPPSGTTCTSGCFKIPNYANCVCKTEYRAGYVDYFDCKTGEILSMS